MLFLSFDAVCVDSPVTIVNKQVLTKFWTRVGTMEHQYTVLKQAGVAHDIKSQ